MAKKILLVEDDAFILKMYQLKMNLEGFEVETAENGKEALELAKSQPDIILLDMMMPELDGFGVLEELQKDPELKAIPVIVLTNLSQDDHVRKAMDLGAIGYIVKTEYTPRQVVERVKEVLDKKSAA